jgi:hypothetical protein
MPSETPSISEIIGQLPRKMQVRFESLGRFVNGIIEEEKAKLDRNIVLTKEDVQIIQLAVFIYSLDNFFRFGTYAARNASASFEQFNLSGFTVGSSVFTRDNINTMRGEELANQLRNVISSTPLAPFIRTAPTMAELVSTLIQELQDGEAAN